MRPKVVTPPPPPPPPAPVEIPQATDPTVQEARIAAERDGRKRKGRKSTLVSGVLGDLQNNLNSPVATKAKSLLGG